MNTFQLLVAGIMWLAWALCLLGLWRPWVVLWWLDYQNRLRVLLYYGIPGLLASILHFLLK